MYANFRTKMLGQERCARHHGADRHEGHHHEHDDGEGGGRVDAGDALRQVARQHDGDGQALLPDR